jgi:hypothetical protein
MSKTIKWATEPTTDDLTDAATFLTLLGVTAARLDSSTPQTLYPAKDLLRASRLPGLPPTNAGVVKWTKRLKAGDQIPPVLLVRGSTTLATPLTIAEGYHRVSACYLLNEQTPVAVHFLTT